MKKNKKENAIKYQITKKNYMNQSGQLEKTFNLFREGYFIGEFATEEEAIKKMESENNA